MYFENMLRKNYAFDVCGICLYYLQIFIFQFCKFKKNFHVYCCVGW